MHFEMRLMQYGDMSINKTWLVFTNEKRGYHTHSFKEQRLTSWEEHAEAFSMNGGDCTLNNETK
jgi:hypothetical protein